MNRLGLFFSVIITITVATYALKAQQKQQEKKYVVTLPLQQWIAVTQQLEYIKGQLKFSDLSSKQISYLSDSLLTPIQATIGSQINAQLEAEKPKTKQDSTKAKKN